MSFSENGESLICNTQDELIFMNLGNERVSDYTINLRKYGCRLSIFYEKTHVIHTSNKLDNRLCLLNLETKSYELYFPGHAKEVESLDAISNVIASGSGDTSVRLWDKRKQESTNTLVFNSTPLVTFHPLGEILVIAHNSSLIEFRQLRNIHEVIQTIKIQKIEGVDWTGIKFSSDSLLLLITTNSSLIIVIEVLKQVERLNLKGELKIHVKVWWT